MSEILGAMTHGNLNTSGFRRMRPRFKESADGHAQCQGAEWQRPVQRRVDHLNELIAGDPRWSFSRALRSVRESGAYTFTHAREELTTADFTWLTGEYVTKTVWDNYRSYPTNFPQLGYRQEVPDFKAAQIIEPYQTEILPRVFEKDEYKVDDLNETHFSVQSYKYGRQFDLSFELLTNDDTDTIRKEPIRMGRSVSATQQYLFSQEYVASATLYTAAQGNLGAGVLNTNNLEAAIATMMGWADRAGNPIMNEPRYLVVPPALSLTAEEILNSVQIMWLGDQSSGQTDRRMPMRSAAANRVSLVIDPWIGRVNGSATTEWYLFADPADIPSVIYCELRGHVGPEVFIKDSDALRLPGGSADAYDGSFLDDDIAFKCRMFFGTAEGEWRGTYRSTGTT